jgi:hypothetical protein
MPNTIAKIVGADGEFERRRHAFGEQRRDRLTELVGDAELALHGADEIAPELDRHGSSRPERAAHLLALGRGRVDRHDLVHRIARRSGTSRRR